MSGNCCGACAVGGICAATQAPRGPMTTTMIAGAPAAAPRFMGAIPPTSFTNGAAQVVVGIAGCWLGGKVAGKSTAGKVVGAALGVLAGNYIAP